MQKPYAILSHNYTMPDVTMEGVCKNGKKSIA